MRHISFCSVLIVFVYRAETYTHHENPLRDAYKEVGLDVNRESYRQNARQDHNTKKANRYL
jgi:hypothetical protein